METEISKVLAAVRDNPPPFALPLLPTGRSSVSSTDGSACGSFSDVDVRDCAMASVNSAPILAAEVERLQGLLSSAGVDQIDGGWKAKVGNSIGLGSTPRDAIEAVIDAEAHRRLAAARVAVEKVGMLEARYTDPNDLYAFTLKCAQELRTTKLELRRSVGLEESHG